MSLELTRELYLVTCKEILTVYLGSVGKIFPEGIFFAFEKTFCHCFTWYYKISHCLSANHNLEFVTLFAMVLHFLHWCYTFALVLHVLHSSYTFCTGVTLNCAVLSQSELSNFFVRIFLIKFIIYTRNIFYCKLCTSRHKRERGAWKKSLFSPEQITQLKRTRESISWQAVFFTQEKNKNIEERRRA